MAVRASADESPVLRMLEVWTNVVLDSRSSRAPQRAASFAKKCEVHRRSDVGRKPRTLKDLPKGTDPLLACEKVQRYHTNIQFFSCNGEEIHF